MSDPKRKSGINAYRQSEVMTANKETVLLLLYEGAIRFLKQAIDAIEAKRASDKAKYILRTHEIVSELRAGLNFKIGGDVAPNLERLYDYIADRLVQGNMKNETQPLFEALKVLTTLHEAWETAIASLRKESSQK
jgi:flagellar secretion chaperone FliS